MLDSIYLEARFFLAMQCANQLATFVGLEVQDGRVTPVQVSGYKVPRCLQVVRKGGMIFSGYEFTFETSDFAKITVYVSFPSGKDEVVQISYNRQSLKFTFRQPDFRAYGLDVKMTKD